MATRTHQRSLEDQESSFHRGRRRHQPPDLNVIAHARNEQYAGECTSVVFGASTGRGLINRGSTVLYSIERHYCGVGTEDGTANVFDRGRRFDGE